MTRSTTSTTASAIPRPPPPTDPLGDVPYARLVHRRDPLVVVGGPRAQGGEGGHVNAQGLRVANLRRVDK